jgi:Protein of unknown function (DUF2934)
MSSEKQMRIERRAYALWQAEGQPHGKHEEHWQRAAHEVEAEEGPTIAALKRSPRRAPKERAVAPGRPSSKRGKGVAANP